MIHSMRRVLTTSFVIVALVFAVSLISTNFSICTNAVGCVASINAYDLKIAGPTTAPNVRHTAVDLVMFNEILRVTTFYAVVTFVVLLGALEFIEPHFVKKVRRSARRR